MIEIQVPVNDSSGNRRTQIVNRTAQESLTYVTKASVAYSVSIFIHSSHSGCTVVSSGTCLWMQFSCSSGPEQHNLSPPPGLASVVDQNLSMANNNRVRPRFTWRCLMIFVNTIIPSSAIDSSRREEREIQFQG